MPKTIALEIPADVVHATHMTAQELRAELALHLFEKGKISMGKASELACIKRSQFQLLLGSRGIPIHYDESSYDDDLETIRDLKLA